MGPACAGFADHAKVNYSIGQYVNSDGFTTNTAEVYFALRSAGFTAHFIMSARNTCTHYCDEFNFRWNGHTIEDVARRNAAVKGAEGKWLMYRMPIAKPKPDMPG